MADDARINLWLKMPVKCGYSQFEREAKQQVLQAGGDPNDTERVPSMSSLQFGRYRLKSFLWLLQNNIDWTAMVSWLTIPKCGKNAAITGSKWDNKEALYWHIGT
ncbi:hypothetical protein ACROYT_G019031 [Oculina patagonica]